VASRFCTVAGNKIRRLKYLAAKSVEIQRLLEKTFIILRIPKAALRPAN
jgi:hypothetical protein